MIIVHDTFICKPGNASKVAKLFKEGMKGKKEVTQILTDMTGQYHRVIVVSQYQSLTAYEKSFEKWSKPTPQMKKMDEKLSAMPDFYTSGSREIYKVW
jgi:hypothetical protein